MKNTANCKTVLLVLVALVSAVTSCAPAASPTPTVVASAAQTPTVEVATSRPPTAVPEASPTSAEVAAPTAVPTEEEPTAVPTPKIVGTPTSPDEVPRISLEDLKALMDSGAYIAILDARARESFQLGHIKGAISFPWKPQLTEVDTELLPWGAAIVTYCDCGPGEADGADVALQLIQLGIEADVKVLVHPSIEGWIELGYPTE